MFYHILHTKRLPWMYNGVSKGKWGTGNCYLQFFILHINIFVIMFYVLFYSCLM
jgi:hypothetical protein